MEISTDPARLDRDLIHRFLAEESYWARSRTREDNDRVIDRSLCFGAYADDGRQIGHARVVTDSVSFGYLADVFVVPEARGRGVGKALMAAILEHPEVRHVRRLALVTDDAHGLYAGFGFATLDDPRKWMQLRRPL
jgi:GNAT superfamily N-acetyltransferase